MKVVSLMTNHVYNTKVRNPLTILIQLKKHYRVNGVENTCFGSQLPALAFSKSEKLDRLRIQF